MSKTEIKCPWCGGAEWFLDVIVQRAWLSCGKCGAKTPEVEAALSPMIQPYELVQEAAEAKAREYLERQPAKEGSS